MSGSLVLLCLVVKFKAHISINHWNHAVLSQLHPLLGKDGSTLHHRCAPDLRNSLELTLWSRMQVS